MLGTNLTWEEIFEQTDRDINLQRVMNVMKYGSDTAKHDWIPERAIGPTEDSLYEAEAEYNDPEVARILDRGVEEVGKMLTSEKRKILMDYRKGELRKLVQVYYEERGWNPGGIPTKSELKYLGLWNYLTEETRERLKELQ
jgi:aldehyde:ferredoxin oxidoreductase